MVTGLGDILGRRQEAAAEINRLKMLIASCDQQLMIVLDAEVDEFTEWAREIRGEITDLDKRKIEWRDINDDKYVIYRRKGAKPRRTIVPERLLQSGVSAQIIKDCTTYGEPGKPGIVVRRVVEGYRDDIEEFIS